MRFKAIDTETSPEFFPKCIKCEKKISSRDGFADLDGEAYKAYYCEPCATAAVSIVKWNMDEIKRASRIAGSHWFDAGSMRFFRSRILDTVYQGGGGVYFVSSEQFEGSSGRAPRMFSIRKFNPLTADISTFGPFNEMARERAKRLARIAAENPEAAKEALGV